MARTKSSTRKASRSRATASPVSNHAAGAQARTQPLVDWPPKDFNGLRFGTTSRQLYTLARDATSRDVRDQLDARINQLAGLTTVITGQGADAFHGWNEEIKNGYLWAVAMAVKECRALLALLPTH